MTTTIGRAVFPNAPASAPSWDGDTLTLRINIQPTSLEQARAFIQQVQGLANNADEPVVPVTSTEEPTLDGFYVVLGVNVEPPRTYRFSNAPIPVTVGLQRVAGGYAFPQAELITGAFTRANSLGLTGDAIAAVWHGVPNAITGGSSWVANSFTRSSADSATTMQIRTATPTLALTSFTWWTPPAAHYYGSARVEVNIGGTWYLVVGRQPPLSDFWRISNGMVRLTSGDGSTPGTIEVWTGSAWESRNIRHFTSLGASGLNIGLAYDSDRSPITIIRNSPEKVIVRCASDSQFIDYSVQRGHHHAEVSPSVVGDQTGIGLDSSHAAACTAITGGIRATANDANGNQVVFGLVNSGGTVTTNLVSGFIYSSGGQGRTMMVGLALDGSGASARNTPASLMDQFIGIAPVKQRIVTR